jgi:hypothetical protein
MTIIKRCPARAPIVRHICRLRQPNRDTLLAYARFLGDSPDYVLTQVIEAVLAKDRDFLAWRDAGAAEVPERSQASADTRAAGDPPGSPRGARS